METIARPYARAAFSIAKDQDGIVSWSDLLERLGSMMQVKELSAVIKNPVFQDTQKMGLFESVLGDIGNGDLNQEQQNFLQLLLKSRRAEYLPAISKMFAVMRQKQENIVEVNITSAYELDDNERAKLTDKITKVIGKKASINLQVEPSLVGGLIIEWNGKVMDASIFGKLEKLTAAL